MSTLADRIRDNRPGFCSLISEAMLSVTMGNSYSSEWKFLLTDVGPP